MKKIRIKTVLKLLLLFAMALECVAGLLRLWMHWDDFLACGIAGLDLGLMLILNDDINFIKI